MIRPMTGLLAGLAMLAGNPAIAQEGATGARYQMQAVEGGLARLDTLTGTIDFCRVEAGAVSCDAEMASRAPGAPDAPDASRLDALEARIEALETGRRSLVDPDDADYAIEQMKKLFSGFGDIVRDLERDFERPEPEDPTPPDRT